MHSLAQSITSVLKIVILSPKTLLVETGISLSQQPFRIPDGLKTSTDKQLNSAGEISAAGKVGPTWSSDWQSCTAGSYLRPHSQEVQYFAVLRSHKCCGPTVPNAHFDRPNR